MKINATEVKMYYRKTVKIEDTNRDTTYNKEGNYFAITPEVISNNNIKSVTVVRMEVPCCGGIEYAVKKALQASEKFIPWRVVTISTDGKILH